MRITKSSLCAGVFLGSLFGYPLTAALTSTFDIPHTAASVAIRVLIFLLSLALVWTGLSAFLKGRVNTTTICVVVFFAICIARLIFEILYSYRVDQELALTYLMWATGSCFLPALALSLNQALNLNQLYKTALVIVLIASGLAAMSLSTVVSGTTENYTTYSYDSGRARLATLNPISLGHLGASLLLLCFAGFWRPRLDRRQFIFVVVGILIGAYLVIASNSRGPIAGVMGGLLVAWLALGGRSKLAISLIIAIVAAGLGPVLFLLENRFGITAYSRLIGDSLLEERNVVVRLDLYWAAWDAFKEKPLFGSGLELTETGRYPHNVTIEAFMSLGIIGGLLLLVLQLRTLRLAWGISRRKPELIWLSMLIVQYLLAAQFSGTLYASGTFWASIGMATLVHNSISAKNCSRARVPKLRYPEPLPTRGV